MKYRILILIFAYFLFTASTCEQPYNIDSLETAKIVVSCHFTPDKPLSVSLNASRPILDSDQRDIVGSVEIIDPDGTIIPLNLEFEGFNKWFVDSTFYPEVGVNYTINAEANTFDPVTANNTIPEPIKMLNGVLDSIRESQNIRSVNKTDFDFSFQFQIEDKPGEHYYHLYALRQNVRYSTDTGDSLFTVFDEYFVSDVMNFNNPPDGLVYGDNSVLFKDDGEQLSTISFDARFSYFHSFEDIKHLRFELRTVSEEYYLFHVAKRKQELNELDILAEPIIPFTNIEDGLGLFGGYSTDRIDIETN